MSVAGYNHVTGHRSDAALAVPDDRARHRAELRLTRRGRTRQACSTGARLRAECTNMTIRDMERNRYLGM